MIAPRRHPVHSALLGAALALGLTIADGALAGDAPPPIDLHAQEAKQIKPPSKDASPSPSPQMSAADVIAKANAYLDDARVMTADFVQIGPDGSRSEGELSLVRPGKMLFRYHPPQKLEIVADGRTVAIRDQKLGTQDLYFIAQTPLKFLLSDHIDLAKDTKVKRVTLDDNAASIEIEDKSTFGGSADIILVFDPQSFALKQWTVVDAQGFQTVVSLFDIDLVTKPDPDLFRIDDTVTPRGSGRH
jgi:outer membrane lipoprotein-sorting protein